MLIAISSVTSPLLFSASGFLSCSVLGFIDIFLHEVPTAKVSCLVLCDTVGRVCVNRMSSEGLPQGSLQIKVIVTCESSIFDKYAQDITNDHREIQ